MILTSNIEFKGVSQRTFIYDVKENDWNEGPSLLTPRWRHTSCTIQSEDGSTKSIIIIGGWNDQAKISKTTEILHIKGSKWVQGPELPLGVRNASCVELPPTSSFACVLIGGYTEKGRYSSDVYGLNKRLTEWIHLGKIQEARRSHIALPIS